MADLSRIKEHMKVVSADNLPVGTVDRVKDDRIVLTKNDPTAEGRHHWIPATWITSIEENHIRLDQTAEQVRSNWHDAEDLGGQTDSRAVSQ